MFIQLKGRSKDTKHYLRMTTYSSNQDISGFCTCTHIEICCGPIDCLLENSLSLRTTNTTWRPWQDRFSGKSENQIWAWSTLAYWLHHNCTCMLMCMCITMVTMSCAWKWPGLVCDNTVGYDIHVIMYCTSRKLPRHCSFIKNCRCLLHSMRLITWCCLLQQYLNSNYPHCASSPSVKHKLRYHSPHPQQATISNAVSKFTIP